MPSDLIVDLLQKAAQDAPTATAITAPDRRALTYESLLDHVGQTVARLNQLGLDRTSRVAMVLPDGPEMATAFLGIAAAAASAPLNPNYRSTEFEFYLKDLEASALALPAGADSPARDVARSLGIPILEISPLMDGPAGLFDITGKRRDRGTVESPSPDDVALVLHTSGTTARPKIVPLTQRNLCCSAQNVRSALRLQETDRCLVVMPLFHIHGLVGALLSSLSAAASVACTPGFYAPRFFGWMDVLSPTWYTAVPTMHQSILARAPEHQAIIERHRLRFVRSSSAALPPRVMAELERTFNAPVIEAYGMTEAAHQIASNPLPPRSRKPGSVGIAAGPWVATMDDAGRLLGPGQPGEVVIRGSNVTPGYANNAAANESAFCSGWFRTGDQGYLDDDGYLFLTGRIKEIINRGGEKIAPREIDEVLLEHPAVVEAVAFGVPHSKLGEEVAAAVILRAGAPATPAELRAFAADRLAGFKVPSQILIVEDIPKGATGKVQRIGLAQKLGVKERQSAEQQASRAPEGALECAVAQMWEEALGTPVGADENFFDAGGDSMIAVQLLARVRDKFRVELPPLCLFDEAATVAEMARMIQRSAARQPSELVRDPDAREWPLSYAQEQLWFLDQLNPGDASYNRPCCLRLSGRLDIPALENSLTALMRRQTALRTVFPAIDGSPVQRLGPPAVISIPVTDLSTLPQNQRQAEALRIAQDQVRKRMDPEHGPLLRCALLRLAPDEHILILAIHHIVVDFESINIVYRELFEFYEACTSHREPRIEPLAVQYGDFARWQKLRPVADLEYWRTKLSGAPQVLDLQFDRPYPSVRGSSGARCPVCLDPDLTSRMKALGGEAGTTLFMTLLAAFDVLLLRASGQQDLCIGTPISTRTHVETQGLIGFFVNMLVLRMDLSGEPTFRELLGRVRRTALEAFRHADVPFEVLVRRLNPKRVAGATPLFNVSFVLNGPESMPEPAGLQVQPYDVDIGDAQWDLDLWLCERGDSLCGWFVFRTDIFEAQTIERMRHEFLDLAAAIAGNPDERISALAAAVAKCQDQAVEVPARDQKAQDAIAPLPLASEAEGRKIVLEWNSTAREYPHRCVHELFEERALQTPDAVAIVHQDQRLTYSELDRKANQLANHLRRMGVGRETAVAISMDRSPEVIVCLLAILKAGGTYVPLDPGYPAERLAYMLEDAGAGILLTHSALAGKAPAGRAERVCVDTLLANAPESDAHRPESNAKPDDLAYLMYTSGSTGKPKGVEITHRGIVRLLFGVDYARFDASRVWLQMASISFDASTLEIWGALLHGGRCVLYPERVPSPWELGTQIQAHGVNTLWLTSALFNTVIDEAPEVLRPITQLLVGGEALSPAHVRRALQLLPETQLINGYGPTENTTFTCCYPIGREMPGGAGSIPIGRPVANTRVYILDEKLQPVPVGVPGTLYAAGDGLARGYRNQPALTEQSFVSGGPVPGERLYNTGDQARYLPDGNIEFLGRLDEQVKIRGFRVELGEIESALNLHPGIRQCAVAADREGSLVAYVAGAQESLPDAREIRDFLSSRLPEYLIPSSVVPLKSLPIGPNGKLDRAALPTVAHPAEMAGYIQPRDAIETELAQIWEEILESHPVGTRDNFFEIGGHSLAAIRVFAQIHTSFGLKLPISTLFQAPTVEQLAAVIRERQSLSFSSLVPIQPAGSKPPFFCVHGLGGHVLNLHGLGRSLGQDQPVYALQAAGLDGERAPQIRVSDMAADYIREIRSVQPAGPYYLGGYSFGGIIAAEMACQLSSEGEEVALLAFFDSGAISSWKLSPLHSSYHVLRFMKFVKERIHHWIHLDLAQKFAFPLAVFNRRARRLAFEAVYRTAEHTGRQLSPARYDVELAQRVAARRHRPKRYPGSAVLFRTDAARRAYPNHPTLGWQPVILGGLQVYDIPGDHRTLFLQPNVELLTEKLRAHLGHPATREVAG